MIQLGKASNMLICGHLLMFACRMTQESSIDQLVNLMTSESDIHVFSRSGRAKKWAACNLQ